MELTDREFVERSRNGHPEDFGVLVERYERPLFAFLTARVNARHKAEEAAQESFVRAFLGLKKLRKPESFFSWLLGIADRVALETGRVREEPEAEGDLAESVAADEAPENQDDRLEEAIAVLPEAYRRVILLRYYEGLSCAEIAKKLGTPLGTVTKTLSRAYALLREELGTAEASRKTNKMEHP